jgi:hypothetical protein
LPGDNAGNAVIVVSDREGAWLVFMNRWD